MPNNAKPVKNIDRFDFRHDQYFELDYAIDADPGTAFPHQLVRRDTNDTMARVRDSELAIALAAVWGERTRLQPIEAEAGIRSAALLEAAEACKLERVNSSETNAPENIAFNIAVDICIMAIGRLPAAPPAKVQGATNPHRLHVAIMNLPSANPHAEDNCDLYGQGHRAARIAAADLVSTMFAAPDAEVQGAAPTGYVLVPLIATPAMNEAYNNVPCGIGGSPAHSSHVWDAMIAAALAAPVAPSEPTTDYRAVLINVQKALIACCEPGGGIEDTLWMPNDISKHETVHDYIEGMLEGGGEPPEQLSLPSFPSVSVPAEQQGLVITLRQAERLVKFFGNHDCEMTVIERPDEWVNQPHGLYAYCTEYPSEGSEYLGETEVDDELAMNGRSSESSERAPACVCGEPSTVGITHRTDGPCHVTEPVGSIGDDADFCAMLLELGEANLDGGVAIAAKIIAYIDSRNTASAPTAKGSIGDDPEFCAKLNDLCIEWSESRDQNKRQDFVAYITNFFASAPAKLWDSPSAYLHPSAPSCVSVDPLAYTNAIPLFKRSAV